MRWHQFGLNGLSSLPFYNVYDLIVLGSKVIYSQITLEMVLPWDVLPTTCMALYKRDFVVAVVESFTTMYLVY